MSLVDVTQKLDHVSIRDAARLLIGSDLDEAMRVYDAELSSANPAVHDILEHTGRYRGKQLRPTLLLLTAEATGGVRAAHHTLAAVIEMIHVATLLHDDVLDDADVRRHVATVNSRWNNQSSILFGDYLFTHAFHLAASLESSLACRRIGAATNGLCEGELTQVSQRGNLDLNEQSYFEIIDGKTGELCAVAAELGALYAGADDQTVAACETFGRRLGVAFQIADDVLDLAGDPSKTGKTLGTDLEKQKLTLPIIRLLTEADESERASIRRILSDPDPSTREELEPFFQRSDAISYARDRAKQCAEEAKRSLGYLPESPGKQLLMALADQAVDRTH